MQNPTLPGDVARELEEILNRPDADTRYDALSGSFGGKVLNADLARELSPRYQRHADRILYTAATYSPCSTYVLKRLLRTLQSPFAKERLVLFLAGGAASGKTTAIGRNVIDAADIVFDSNLAQLPKAKLMIEAALTAGWVVFIIYVHRNFRVACESMLERAVQNGRHIPFRSAEAQDLASLHFNAQRTIVELDRIYADNDRVVVRAFRNPWTPERPLAATPISITTLAAGGKRHYTSIRELYEVQDALANIFRAQDRISTELARCLGISSA